MDIRFEESRYLMTAADFPSLVSMRNFAPFAADPTPVSAILITSAVSSGQRNTSV
jgi:hypothetical protein